MPATFTPQFANPDPSANPTSVAAFVTLLNALALTGNVAGGPFTPYVISSTTPAVGDQDKIWAKVDGNGRPLGLFLYYSGNWRRFYNGKVGEISNFNGNSATYFDGTGLGLVGLDWDGWALCNGQNGTPNLSNLFIVGAQMDNVNISGYAAGHWQTNITGSALQTGGAASYALINDNLPYMPVFVTGHRYSAGAGNSPRSVLVDGDYAATPQYTDPNPIAQFGANPNGAPPVAQIPVPTTPPFYAMAYVQWVGYA